MNLSEHQQLCIDIAHNVDILKGSYPKDAVSKNSVLFKQISISGDFT